QHWPPSARACGRGQLPAAGHLLVRARIPGAELALGLKRRGQRVLTALQVIGGALLVLLLAAVAIRLANPLPPLEPRRTSTHVTDTADTPLGQGVAALPRDDPALSGIHPLIDGHAAFAARVLLARAATRS